MASASDGKLMIGATAAATTATVELTKAFDFTPADLTYSTSSSEYYGGAISSRKSELGEASFKIFLDNGVSDTIITAAGESRFFQFFPDRNVATKYITMTGYVSIKRTFPVGDQMQADVTIVCSAAATNVSS